MNRSPKPIDFTPGVRARISESWTPERRDAQRERNALDLIGQRFGRLVAVRRLELSSQGYRWECRCDCGSTHVVVAGALRSGGVQSCGCLRHEKISGPKPHRRKRPYEHLLNRVHYQAAARGLGCDLTYEQFLKFVEQAECHYCGARVVWEPVTVRRRSRFNLDRKDNAVGYTATNLVVCCWECNDGKGDRYTFYEWVAMSRALRAVRGV